MKPKRTGIAARIRAWNAKKKARKQMDREIFRLSERARILNARKKRAEELRTKAEEAFENAATMVVHFPSEPLFEQALRDTAQAEGKVRKRKSSITGRIVSKTDQIEAKLEELKEKRRRL